MGLVVESFPALPAGLGRQRDLTLLSGSETVDEPFVRPWDLSALSPTLAEEMWDWLDRVVIWLNVTYAWQVEQVIPVCWMQHPGLVTELATLALARLDAWEASIVIRAEDWHVRHLPAFIARMNDYLGPGANRCRNGQHQDAPAAVVVGIGTADGAVDHRRTIAAADVAARRKRSDVDK